jgi:hypothetical protein
VQDVSKSSYIPDFSFEVGDIATMLSYYTHVRTIDRSV